MPEISLTDFVDFVVKAGTPKLTKVRQVKDRGDYDPATDFWRPLREAITNFHQQGGTDKRQLDRVLTAVTDRKKSGRYASAVHSYKKFLGRKQTTWFDPPRDVWSNAGLDVRVNPELGVIINGTRHATKLYFKDDKPDKRKFDVVLAIMEEALRGNLLASSTLSGGGTQRTVDISFSADRNALFSAWNAMANLADMAGQVTVIVRAESSEGFDKSKLENGVVEPLREVDLIE